MNRTEATSRPGTGPGVTPAPVRVDGLRQVLAKAERERVSATFWSEELLELGGDVVARIRGHRLDVDGKPGPQDKFVREERIGQLPPGSGPFSLSIQVADVNPGEWSVSAELLPADPARRPRGPKRARSKQAGRGAPLRLAAWSHRRLRDAETDSVTTTTAIGVRRPGVVRGGWAAMVALGVVSALTVQQILFRLEGLPAVSGLAVSLLAAVAGGIGAKAWYVVLDRKHGRWNGWCIQGFVAALVPVLVVGGPLIGVPVGRFFDLSTPPLFLGMAIGRLGCFTAGCCGGRPTRSRFGVWASDRRVGVRRIPTQLLEASLSLAMFAATLSIVTEFRPDSGGAIFAGAVAAYTLVRQLLLRFRAEARRTTLGTWVTAGVAAAVLIAVAAISLG